VKALRLGLVVSMLTTALAGVYFVVYLYRWEMHRALVSGVVFLAGEIALATSLVLRRVEQMREQSPNHVGSLPPAATPVAPPPSAEAGAPPPMPWLGADRFGVFVPIMLGAGAIVSGVAWVVEQLARSSASSGRADGLDREFAPLAPPVGGLSGGAPHAARPQRHVSPPVGRLAQASIAVFIGGLAVGLVTLALLGRSRTDPSTAGERSVIEFEVRTRNDLDVVLAASSLWESCRLSAPDQTVVEMVTVEPGAFRLVLEPALGPQTERRLLGCLRDGTIDQVNADLRSHVRVAAPG
jgi:hypothetical protein